MVTRTCPFLRAVYNLILRSARFCDSQNRKNTYKWNSQNQWNRNLRNLRNLWNPWNQIGGISGIGGIGRITEALTRRSDGGSADYYYYYYYYDYYYYCYYYYYYYYYHYYSYCDEWLPSSLDILDKQSLESRTTWAGASVRE